MLFQYAETDKTDKKSIVLKNVAVILTSQQKN